MSENSTSLQLTTREPLMKLIMQRSIHKIAVTVSGILIYLLAVFAFPLAVFSADKDDKPFAEQHVILQVSDADPAKYTAVLDIANNLIKHYQGPDFVDIEIIAFGKGVQMYFAQNNVSEVNANSSRISSLRDNGVRFYVCLNTIDSIQRSTGKRPVLLEGIEGVQTGVAFMLEEIQAGYTHIHP